MSVAWWRVDRDALGRLRGPCRNTRGRLKWRCAGRTVRFTGRPVRSLLDCLFASSRLAAAMSPLARGHRPCNLCPNHCCNGNCAPLYVSASSCKGRLPNPVPGSVADETVATRKCAWYQCTHERTPQPVLFLVLRFSNAAGGGRIALTLKDTSAAFPKSRQRTLAAFLLPPCLAPRCNTAHRDTVMPPVTDDLRIRKIEALAPPSQLLSLLPCDERASETVTNARCAAQDPARARRPPGGGDRALLDPRPGGGDGVRAAPAPIA